MNEKFKLDSNKGIIISVSLVLVLVSSLLLGYYLITRQPPEGYTTIFLLDQNRKAIDYPELLVLGYNNTMNVWVEVENHMGKTIQFQVRLKAVNETISLSPVQAEAINFTETLHNGDIWEAQATSAISNPGSYSIIYELWMRDQDSTEWVFTHNYCVLNIEVVS